MSKDPFYQLVDMKVWKGKQKKLKSCFDADMEPRWQLKKNQLLKKNPCVEEPILGISHLKFLAQHLKSLDFHLEAPWGRLWGWLKLDPQDDWHPITESRNGNKYYVAFILFALGFEMKMTGERDKRSVHLTKLVGFGLWCKWGGGGFEFEAR